MRKKTLELTHVGSKKIIALCMSWALKNIDNKELKDFVEEKLQILTDGPFYNIFDEDITLCFLSSRPNLMQIAGVDESEGKLRFAAKETKEMEIKITSIKKTESVKLYIYDSENGGNKIQETLDFTITIL